MVVSNRSGAGGLLKGVRLKQEFEVIKKAELGSFHLFPEGDLSGLEFGDGKHRGLVCCEVISRLSFGA